MKSTDFNNIKKKIKDYHFYLNIKTLHLTFNSSLINQKALIFYKKTFLFSIVVYLRRHFFCAGFHLNPVQHDVPFALQ